MHETSMAMGFLTSLVETVKKENAKEVKRVRVKIGKLSGIVVDSFEFAFDTLKEEFPETRNAKLEIEEIPLIYRCKDCGHEFEADSLVYFPECPKCGSVNLEIASGEELKVVDVELEV